MTLIKKIILVMATYILLLTPVSAVPGDPLMMRLPEGWKLAYANEDKARKFIIHEYIPEQQYKPGWEDNWRDMFSMMYRPKEAVPGGALEYFNGNIMLQKQACSKPLAISKIQKMREQDYDMYMTMLACEKVKSHGLSEVTMFKVLEGEDNLVVLWFSIKGLSFSNNQPNIPQEVFSGWQNFLDHTIIIPIAEVANPKKEIVRKFEKTYSVQGADFTALTIPLPVTLQP